jgi:hypothetical protein
MMKDDSNRARCSQIEGLLGCIPPSSDSSCSHEALVENITIAMHEAENMPCGGIGKNGPMLKELDDYAKQHCQPMEDDAMYHAAQRIWRLLERALSIIERDCMHLPLCEAVGKRIEIELREKESETRRADQLGINCRWLVAQLDAIHAVLCLGHIGTWQDRAQKAVEAAKIISQNADLTGL